MKTLLRSTIRLLRKIKLRTQNTVILRKGCVIGSHVSFEGSNTVGERTILSNCKVGVASFIGEKSEFNGTVIGRFCSIGSRVRVVVGRHPSKVFVSTHPAFYSLLKQAGFTFVNQQFFVENRYADESNHTSVIIGNDVWIGSDVVILEGVKIGDGAIIGAGSVVNRDVEPYSINVGVPAVKVGSRFDQEQINFLLNFKWWERDMNWLKENSDAFRNIEGFTARFSTKVM